MDGKDIVRKGYDEIAPTYLGKRCQSSEDISLIGKLIEKLPEDSLVLDAGCGAGVPVAKMLSKHFKVVGVDFSESQIELARENVPEAEFLIQDLSNLDFPENHFDAIVSYYAIIHIPREEHQSILKTFSRILRPGGLLLLCTGATDLKDDISDNYLGTRMYWSHYGSETNKKIVEDVGFEIIWTKEIGDETCDGGKHLFILAKK